MAGSELMGDVGCVSEDVKGMTFTSVEDTSSMDGPSMLSFMSMGNLASALSIT